MKQCPVCSRTYSDQSLAFCLEDGTALHEVFTPSPVTKQYDPGLPFINRAAPAAGGSTPYDAQNPPRLKVSFIVRLLTAFCYAIPALGGALSSMSLINVFQALRSAETAGIGAVMAGLNEASTPVLVSLYLGAFGAIVVIVVLIVRMMVRTKTASPPAWFFAVGVLGLVPAGLFWKARSLVIDVLSPGSSVGEGGIAAVGAEISQWLILSVIAAPVVFILLIAASVIPFSSRSKAKWGSLATAAAIAILLFATAIGLPFLNSEPKRKNDTVKLPENIKYVEQDYNIERESSIVLTLAADNKLYLKQKTDVSGEAARTDKIVTREELPDRLKKFSESMPPDKQIVYLKADISASFENVLQIFEIIRKAEIDRVGLVVIGEKNDSDPYQTSSTMLGVKLPEPPKISSEPLRPNPNTLIAMLEADGGLRLNNEESGTVSDAGRLENRLTEIFKDRESRGVFREGTNEIEKTVFLKVSKSVKYGEFIKLAEAVKGAGAEPIAVQID